MQNRDSGNSRPARPAVTGRSLPTGARIVDDFGAAAPSTYDGHRMQEYTSRPGVAARPPQACRVRLVFYENPYGVHTILKGARSRI